MFFHKAFRGELGELLRLANDAVAASNESDKRRRETAVVELRRRLEFFRTVFRYHCAAEDEVYFAFFPLLIFVFFFRCNCLDEIGR